MVWIILWILSFLRQRSSWWDIWFVKKYFFQKYINNVQQHVVYKHLNWGREIWKRIYWIVFIWAGGRLMGLLESPAFGRKYLVGKSGAWPKIFGWELEKVWKIFGLKLEKSGYLWDYKDWVVALTLLLLYIASATFAGSSKNVRISIVAGDFWNTKYAIFESYALKHFFEWKSCDWLFLVRFIWTDYCLTLIYRIFRQNYFRWYREVRYKTYTEIRNKTFSILIIYRLVYRAVRLSQCLK